MYGVEGWGHIVATFHSLLMMQLTRSADMSGPAFGLQEDILNIHCDMN